MTNEPIPPDDPMKAEIDAMTRVEMAHRWRHSPIGDPMFQPPYGEYFQNRFADLGGMNPEISKQIGW